VTGSTARPSATGPLRTGGLTGLLVPPVLLSVQAHQGEELIFILPAAILVGTWLIAVWPSKARSSKDTLELHQEDPETAPTEIAEPPGGA